MIDRTDFIPGPVCRLCNVACGKAGDKHPPFHNSSVCFPAFDGTMRICAPGNSFRSSVPGEEVVEEERQARDLGMGLAGDGHIEVGKAVNLAGHFLCPDNDEDLFMRPDLADDVRQVQAVHGQMDDHSPGGLPLFDAGAPLHVVLAEEVPAPAFRNIRDAPHNPLVGGCKVHTLSRPAPGR